MKIGSGKPVVGATLAVARFRHQPVFISLCGLHNAMVIPNAAKRSEESRISRYRSRAIRNTFYFLLPPAISASSAVSHDAPGIDKQERLYYTFHMRSPISQLYNNVKNAPECPRMPQNAPECPRMPHFSKNSPDSQVLALPRFTPLNHSSEPPSAAAYAEASECSNVRAGA